MSGWALETLFQRSLKPPMSRVYDEVGLKQIQHLSSQLWLFPHCSVLPSSGLNFKGSFPLPLLTMRQSYLSRIIILMSTMRGHGFPFRRSNATCSLLSIGQQFITNWYGILERVSDPVLTQLMGASYAPHWTLRVFSIAQCGFLWSVDLSVYLFCSALDFWWGFREPVESNDRARYIFNFCFLEKTEAHQAPLGIAEQYKEVKDDAAAVELRARSEGATPQAGR